MRKDDSNVRSYCKHTGNVYGGRRRVNKSNRRNIKFKIYKNYMLQGSNNDF